MRERGTVVAASEGTVDVRMVVSSACGGCTLCSMRAGGETVMRGVRDALGARVGDTVEVEIPDAVTPRAAVAVFVAPVVALFAGYLAGFLLGGWAGLDGDRTGTLTAVTAGAIAIAGARFANGRLVRSERFSPSTGAIIARGPERA